MSNGPDISEAGLLRAAAFRLGRDPNGATPAELRARAIARTHAETAFLWADKARMIREAREADE